jgi:hypothetical protein
MGPGQKRTYKVFQAGGRSFPVYLEYDEQLDESYPPNYIRKQTVVHWPTTSKALQPLFPAGVLHL